MLLYCQIILNFQGAEALLYVRSFSKYIITEYLLMFFQSGRYVSYNDAKDIIIQSDYIKKDKQHMLALLSKISKCKNMNEATKKVQEEYDLSAYQISSIISKYSKLKINPITLKNEQSHIKILPSIYELLNVKQ